MKELSLQIVLWFISPFQAPTRLHSSILVIYSSTHTNNPPSHTANRDASPNSTRHDQPDGGKQIVCLTIYAQLSHLIYEYERHFAMPFFALRFDYCVGNESTRADNPVLICRHTTGVESRKTSFASCVLAAIGTTTETMVYWFIRLLSDFRWNRKRIRRVSAPINFRNKLALIHPITSRSFRLSRITIKIDSILHERSSLNEILSGETPGVGAIRYVPTIDIFGPSTFGSKITDCHKNDSNKARHRSSISSNGGRLFMSWVLRSSFLRCAGVSRGQREIDFRRT